MNSKNINNFIFVLFFCLFLSSCQFRNEKNANNENILTDKNNNIENIENIIPNIKNSSNKNYIDYYSLSRNYKYNINFELNKEYVISNSKLKISEKPVNIIINNDIIYSLDKKFFLNKYNLLDGKLISKTKFDDAFLNEFSLPQSMAFYNDNIFINFSDGIIINYDLNGNILWQQNLGDISKTPIKFYNQNLIILLSNKILSLNSKNGKILWEYEYIQDNPLSSVGGEILTNKHLLYFMLPNGRIGEIDSLILQKNDSLFANIQTEKHILNINNKIHTNKNIVSLLENNKYLTTIDIDNNQFILNKEKIENFISSHYYSNLLLTHNNLNLSAYNLLNKKLFWKTIFDKNFSQKSRIIEVISNNKNLTVFFSDGFILEIDIKNGNIINKQNLKLKDIYTINFYNDFIFITLFNGKTIFYKQ
tara:strand:+ start:5210 stop:6469 length:1260 start_codon:yes stop_codon:yes gene_type:complete